VIERDAPVLLAREGGAPDGQTPWTFWCFVSQRPQKPAELYRVEQAQRIAAEQRRLSRRRRTRLL